MYIIILTSFFSLKQDQVDAQLLAYIQNYTKSTTSSHYDKGGNSVIDFVQKTVSERS